MFVQLNRKHFRLSEKTTTDHYRFVQLSSLRSVIRTDLLYASEYCKRQYE